MKSMDENKRRCLYGLSFRICNSRLIQYDYIVDFGKYNISSFEFDLLGISRIRSTLSALTEPRVTLSHTGL